MNLDELLQVRITTGMKEAIQAEALRRRIRPADLVRSVLADTLDETKSVATAIKSLTTGPGDDDPTLSELREALVAIKSRGG